MRKGELQNLIWDNVDFVGRVIHIRPVDKWIPKTWEMSAVPMHPVVYETLKELPRRSEWVFTSKRGRPLSHPRAVFVRICSKLGIRSVTFHTLRHTFASHLLTRKGVDIETVSKLLGHSSIETTMIYLHTNMANMRSGVERLDFTNGKVLGTNLAQTGKRRLLSRGPSRTTRKMAEKEGFEPSIGLYSL
jgi:integrase